MTPTSNVIVFDLDDTLYKEVDFLKSAYTEIASTIIGKIPTLGLPLATEGTQEICAPSPNKIPEICEICGFNKYLRDQMLSWWRDGDNVFQRLIVTYHLDLTIDDLLTMYRTHIPQISLDTDTKSLLQRLSETAVLGLITDGRSITQHNKITALGLAAFMHDDDILVSGDRNHRLHRLHRLEGLNGEDSWEKPSELPFKYFMHRYPVNHSANRSVNRKPYTVRSANGRLLPTGRKNYYYLADNPSKDFVSPNRLGWTTICLLDDGRNIHHQDFSLPQPMLPQHTISNITEIENIII